MSFGSSPERLDELTAAVLQEIDSLKRTGPRADELAKAQEQLRRGMETGLEQNGFWVSQLLTYDEQGIPLSEIPQARRLVDALTPATLQAAARRYFDTSRYVQVSLLPER